jgi:nucleoid-associated protein YgaU
MLERLAKAEDQVANLAAEREEFTRSTAQIKELQAQWKQEREGLLARVRLEEEERAQLMQDYADLSERASDLAKYRERYHAEHDLRIQKERRFAALAKRLQEQRYALEMIERTKQQALEELHHNKQSVTESPHTIGDAVDSSTEEFAYRQPTSRQARTHIVDSGDTLSGISLKYYGTTSRWADIFEANRDKLPSSDRVTAGVELVIPD